MSEVRANREPLVAPGAMEHHVADMTATFSADVTLGEASAKLADAGQWLPIDGDANESMGKLVEMNSSGPLRLGYGHWRDLLLGAQFLNGMGELITAGGRTVKNVAGYDLTKFMVGQGGVFGRLVTLTTRTYKRPAAVAMATFAPDLQIVNRLMPTDLRPQWMIVNREALWMGYVGDERTVTYCAGKVKDFGAKEVSRRSIEEDIAHRARLWKTVGNLRFRAAVPPSRIFEFVDAAKLSSWVADAAFGIVIGEATDRTAIGAAAKKVSGTVAFFEGDEIVYEPGAQGQRELLERLKQSFDPEGRLKPLPWQR